MRSLAVTLALTVAACLFSQTPGYAGNYHHQGLRANVFVQPTYYQTPLVVAPLLVQPQAVTTCPQGVTYSQQSSELKAVLNALQPQTVITQAPSQGQVTHSQQTYTQPQGVVVQQPQTVVTQGYSYQNVQAVAGGAYSSGVQAIQVGHRHHVFGRTQNVVVSQPQAIAVGGSTTTVVNQRRGLFGRDKTTVVTNNGAGGQALTVNQPKRAGVSVQTPGVNVQVGR